jgi:oxygen-independent coproporphyrinogen-3 oxidase
MASIYMHIPFCERKCLYCDFYSVESTSLMEQFVDSLLSEIGMYASYAPGVSFDTVYLGGGTPSLLPVRSLGKIFDRLRRTFTIADGSEVTMEINPGTVSKEKLERYRSLGVNRLSVGVQSFRDEDLQFLSRIHTAREADEAVAMARSAGFVNLSLDLIFSLPGQTVEDWERNLVHALRFDPEHLSAYSLVVEDETPLARLVRSGKVTPSPEPIEAAMLEFTMDFLCARGFDHYEVSNYARPGFRSRHNSSYWSHRQYLGFGPSAHSFWRRGTEGQATRWQNVPDLARYIDRIGIGGLPVSSEEVVSQRSLINERIFLGLRADGLDLASLEKDFRFVFDKRHREVIERLVRATMMEHEHGRLRLTPKGFLVCDEIAAELLIP